MINKTKTLGRDPQDLGIKDAVHVAIVSVRAAAPLVPGQRIKLNDRREAVAHRGENKCLGIVDPFHPQDRLQTGDRFWMLLHPDEVRNVAHTWEHDENFNPPDGPPKRNVIIQAIADKLAVDYPSLMEDCAKRVQTGEDQPYVGSLTDEQLEHLIETETVELHELWWEWSEETGHDFPNYGTECCPEYDLPRSLYKY